MADYFQKDHLLRIDTILNDDKEEQKYKSDPLLLVKLDGVESISRLYSYDIIMLRDAGGKEGEVVNGQKRPPIDTTKLIGTHAVIGARPSDDTTQTDDTIWFKRVGMFETFEDLLGLDITAVKTFIPINAISKINVRDFHIYKARVVPWVKVLSRDVCYRVFEGKTVVEIIEAIADEAKKTFSHLLIDTKGLHNSKHPFTPMDYCVQFGESTLDFLSRIMARFGIWYYFGHSPNEGNYILNETMFLKGNWDRGVPVIGFSDVKIADGDPGIREIGKLVRRFRPPERRVAVGGFNYLDPSNPFYKDDTVDPKDDLLKNEGGPASQSKFSGSTSFAQPVFSAADAEALATSANSQNQSEVYLLSGISKNQTMIPGHSFHIDKAKDFDPNDDEKKPYVDIVDKKFVIDTMAITVNDYNYVTLKTHIPGFDLLLDALAHTVNALQADAIDNTNDALYKVSLWTTATAQAKIYTAVNPLAGNFADTAAGMDMDIAGLANMATGLAGSIPVVGSVLSGADFKKAVTDAKNMAAFAVGVIAVPADPPVDPSLPLSTRPVARGLHTALVIGPDDGKGVELHGQDIYCDALGRVRIRFPWDPGPPQGGSKIPPIFPFAESNKPTKVGGNTCWVRVSEGWAGRYYGTQFLPRIGQEVLVDFLDGDPERPVITGRLYNADRRYTNLPFPPSSQEKTELLELSKLPNTTAADPPLSGIKTYSIPSTDSDGKMLSTRFHLLRFSDKRDHEQYLIRSQRRLDITALERRYESISSDRHLTVGGKKITPPPKEIGGDYIAKVFRHYHLHVGDPEFPTQSGNRNTLLEQNENLQVKGSSNEMVGGNWSVTVSGDGPTPGGQATIDAPGPTGVIVLNAMLNITLSVGPNSIVITPAGISITAPTINLVSPAILSTVPVIPAGAAPLPPMPPIDAGPVTPTEPTAADPGNNLTPPDE
jgi:uncharacterized protein involved in type VI secretion and phage assembly